MMIRNLMTGLLLLAAAFSAQGNESPTTIDGARTVTTDEAYRLFKSGALFLDVRRDSDWDAGRIPGAAHLNLKTTFSEASLAEEAGKDEAIVIYCNGRKCMRSSQASIMAVGWGFNNIHYYRDGFPAWKQAGYPVE